MIKNPGYAVVISILSVIIVYSPRDLTTSGFGDYNANSGYCWLLQSHEHTFSSSPSSLPQIYCWNFDLGCRSYRDKNISGFVSHITISGIVRDIIALFENFRFAVWISMLSVIVSEIIAFPVLAAILIFLVVD